MEALQTSGNKLHTRTTFFTLTWLQPNLVTELIEFNGFEGLSQAYTYTALVSLSKAQLPTGCILYDLLKSMLGESVVISLQPETSDFRQIYGLINGATLQQQPLLDTGLHIQLQIVSPLWNLKGITYNRTFHKKTLLAIVKQLCKEAIGEDSLILETNAAPQASTVIPEIMQYNESNAVFLERLLAEFGIGYYLTYKQSEVYLELFEALSSLSNLAVGKSIPVSTAIHSSHGVDMQAWYMQNSLQPHHFAAIDYESENPQTLILTKLKGMQRIPVLNHGKLEREYYPGLYHRETQGQKRLFHHAYATDRTNKLYGYSRQAQIAAGSIVQVDGQQYYHVIKVKHCVKRETSDVSQADCIAYSNELELIPLTTAYQPPAYFFVTPAWGLQRGVAIGDANEASVVDEQGRLPVKLTWQQHGSYNAKVRKGQSWGGGVNRGWHYPIRCGDALWVGFAHGQFERALVIGQRHSQYHTSTYTPKEQILHLGIKTQLLDNSGRGHALTFIDKPKAEAFNLMVQGQYRVQSRQDITYHSINHHSIQVDERQTESSGNAYVLQGEIHVNLTAGKGQIKLEPDIITLKGPSVHFKDP